MNDTRRYRYNAAECLLAAKNCQSGYGDVLLSISSCWHSLARQEEAMVSLLAIWTQTQIAETAGHTAGGRSAQETACDGVQLPA